MRDRRSVRPSPLALVLLCALLLTMAVPWSTMADEPAGADVLFESARGRQIDIWKLAPDGTISNLTNNPATDRDPARSPDGQWVAFQSTRTGGWQIFMVGMDGTGTKQLSNTKHDAIDPSWSPDGTRVAYQARGESWRWEIHVVDVNTLEDKIVATDSMGETTNPVWSPDGQEILYQLSNVFSAELYVVNADGTNAHPLIEGGNFMYEGNPIWSPDGTKLLIEATPGWFKFDAPGNQADGTDELEFAPEGNNETINIFGSFRAQLYVLDIATGQMRALTSNRYTNIAASWSPDGSRIVFQSDRFGSWAIFVANADGSNVVRLLNTWTAQEAPCWSADGQEVIYLGQSRTGGHYLYAVSPDGSGTVRQLTNAASGTQSDKSAAPDKGNLARTTANPAPDGMPVGFPGERDYGVVFLSL
jgi:Tol biopolymer transport system component